MSLVVTPRAKTWVELAIGVTLLIVASASAVDYLHKADWGWAAGTFIGALWAADLTRRAWGRL